MKKNLNKILAVALAVTMLALIGVSATLAYLYDTDDEVVNTFTVGKVYVELTEAAVELQIVPADTDAKQPQVNLEADSEAAYVFVKVDESLGDLQTKATALGKTFADYVTYSVDTAIWTKLDGTDNIWYKAIAEADDTKYDILTGDQVSYPAAITNEMLQAGQTAPTGAAGTLPTLTFTVYAIQQLGFADEAAAYTELRTVYTELPAIVVAP